MSLGAAAAGLFLVLVLLLVGVVTTSSARIAGRALAPLGAIFCFVALVLVGLRYLGVDTGPGCRGGAPARAAGDPVPVRHTA